MAFAFVRELAVLSDSHELGQRLEAVREHDAWQGEGQGGRAGQEPAMHRNLL